MVYLCMDNESVSATRTIHSPADAVFAVLADPTRHAGIDGTGWVTEALDTGPIVNTGQIFQMAMYHPDHPDGGYETVNEIIALRAPCVISWRTGYIDQRTGRLEFGGWWWRYHLTLVEAHRTDVTLTYDWSDVGPGPREHLNFPPFPADHLDNSLRHLSDMLAG